MRLLHRASAYAVGVFALFHLLNHAMAAFGPDAHRQVAAMLGRVYRHPLVEPVLLTCVAVQVGTGVRLVRGFRARGFAQKLRRYSGLYLAFFLLAHTSAVMVQRYVLGGQSDIRWATAVLRFPLLLWFVPYYVAGVTSLLVHLGLALNPRHARAWLLGSLAIAGLLVVALFQARAPGPQ